MGESGGTSSNSGSGSSSIVVAGGDSVITPVAMPLPSDYTIMDDNSETIVKGKKNECMNEWMIFLYVDVGAVDK